MIFSAIGLRLLIADYELPLLTGLAFTGLCALVMSLVYFGTRKASQSPKALSTNSAISSTRRTRDKPPANRRETIKCPFSSEVSFVQETAEHLPPSPLDLYGNWTDHLATRWLAAGLSGQDTPGLLRAGLKRLRHSRHFLVQEPHRIQEELLLKKKNLDDPGKRALKFVMEPDSVEAQKETLELFTAYLPEQYPVLYSYNKESHSLTVHPINTTFSIDEWMNRPLELCCRIVQEDLILMRPGEPLEDAKPGTEGYYLAAAGVVFSFTELFERLGKPVEFIHAPVPGYEKHLRKTINMLFTGLKVEQPLWRNNWGLSPKGTLDEPLSSSEETLRALQMPQKVSEEDVKAMFLRVEYQTIRRLPRTKYLLFTVKTMVDSISGLEEVTPKAAQCLAASIRGMSRAMRSYNGISGDVTCQAVLSYLDSIGCGDTDK